MNNENMSKQQKYFAAQNSYMGFKSHFNEIINPKDYTRIFILKGGPGTGKSSFMKTVAKHFDRNGLQVDEILCSSDPASLDGIIIKNNKASIAIMDGTSPHNQDPKFPGAVEEIIDLGGFWDKRWLSAQRNEIVEIATEKEKAYKTAYSYLNIAGTIYNEARKIYSNIFDKDKAKSLAESIIPKEETNKISTIEKMFVSAFGKNGYFSLNETLKIDKEIILSGSEIICDLFFDVLYEFSNRLGLSIIKFVSPLDENIIEKLYIKTKSTIIKRGSNGTVDLNGLVPNKNSDIERCRIMLEMREASMNEAVRWFSIASDLHFRLEEIYGKAMDFSKNQEIIHEKLSQIENILQNAR